MESVTMSRCRPLIPAFSKAPHSHGPSLWQDDIAMGTGNGVAVPPTSCIDVTMMGHAANNK